MWRLGIGSAHTRPSLMQSNGEPGGENSDRFSDSPSDPKRAGVHYGVSMSTVLGTWISLDAFMVLSGEILKFN